MRPWNEMMGITISGDAVSPYVPPNEHQCCSFTVFTKFLQLLYSALNKKLKLFTITGMQLLVCLSQYC